jgi:acetyl esterase/lipase
VIKIVSQAVCVIGLALASSTLSTAGTTWEPSAGHTQMQLWPAKIPDARPATGTEETKTSTDLIAGKPIVCAGNVSKPTMTVYPAQGKNTGAAVVIFPGGGYQILAMDLEGTEVCDWLTSKGITCVLLKYRVPGEGKFPKSGAYPRSKLALEDAQRAMGLIRLHAAEWHIDSHKIGVLGFSAGGHLVGAISTNYKKRLYPPVDAADKLSCRPDFGVALYPGHMLENTTRDFQLNPYVPVTKDTPPQFILQAENDPVDDVQNSLVYFAALKKAKVPAEMHIYAEGKHAFGLRRTKYPITAWTDLVDTWLKTIGIVGSD